MPGNYPTMYQRARKETLLSQEQAAEQLYISTESVKAYERGQRVPPNDVVCRMAETYGTPWLALEHLEATSGQLGVLPEITVQTLSTASIVLINRVLEFADRHRDRQLLRIAEDGIIDETERPEFEAIIHDLDGIIGAAFQVKFTSSRDIKKDRSAAGTTERSVFRTCVENDHKIIIPHRTQNASPNLAGEGVTAL